MDKFSVSELIETHKKKAEEAETLANKAEKAIASPQFFEDLNRSIDNVGQILDTIIEQNSDKKVVLMVGGKSRRLTDLLLSKVQNRQPEESPVRELISKRVRLDDEENSLAYTKNIPRSISERLRSIKTVDRIRKEGDIIVFIDDHASEGAKASILLHEFKDSKFVAFASPANPVDFSRPGSEGLDTRFFYGSDGEELNSGLSAVSRLMSAYVDVRLNQSFPGYGLHKIPAQFDYLDKEHRQSLRQVNDFLSQIDDGTH